MVSVIVWAAVSKSWKSPLTFIKQGTKPNINVYIEDISIPASQAIKKHFENKNFTFQQDNAPSHTSRKTQAWCRANFPNFWIKEMWPPASPDLNPLDFNIWSILEAEAYAKTHNTIEGLKVSLKKAWAKIPQEKLRVLVESFRGRLKQIVKAKEDILKYRHIFYFMIVLVIILQYIYLIFLYHN